MLKSILKFIGLALLILTVTVATFAIVAPYVFLDFPAFRSNLEYEGGLALGKIPVFYTRQFIDTIPIIFQMEKIFPYALGPAFLILGIAGFFVMILRLGRVHLGGVHPRFAKASPGESATSKVLIIAFLSLFLPSAFLFTKWTRFITPTFPFFAIFAAFLLQELEKKMLRLYYFLGGFLLFATTLWTTAFFSIYTNDDIRITASKWLEPTALPGSTFLVEGGNTIDLPLHGNFPRTSLHFYALEDDPITREKIIDALYSSDYFLVQSRRVFMNHQRLPNLYPRTAKFYDNLFNGKLGFKQMKTFYSYPQLSLLGLSIEFPDEKAEETWSVFDHPVIRVFKKNEQLTREGYSKFLKI